MNRVVKAVIASAAATGVAYVIWSLFSSGDRKTEARLEPPLKEVDVDSLPEDLRKELLAELDEQL